ncbi:MAG: peptidylprolyl isomerase [Synechococcaceae cyanobacterium RL_1_2]|nr:peptidylprolyl isomerase [Synechococcaceae cyanobacterium RL_1_2]
MTITALQIGEEILKGEKVLDLLAQYQMLPDFAKETIVNQAIANIECTPEEQNNAIAQFQQQMQIASLEQLQVWLEQNGLTMEQLNLVTTRNLRLDKYKQQAWGIKVDSYFMKRKSQLDKVIYSLIRTKDVGIAQELYFRVVGDEEPFAELARQYSEGNEAQTGGLIGPVELNTPHPALAKALKASQPGEVCAPMKVGEWYVIVKLEKFLSAQLDEQTRKRLLDELFNDWIEQTYRDQVSIHRAP